MPRKKKLYQVVYTITGRADAIVQATSLEEAKKKAEKCDFVGNSDSIIEWSFDEVESIEEDK